MTALFLEEHLDTPLRDLLPAIQNRIMKQTSYFGIPTLKNPLDYWVYQEIINETRPDVIIEIGNRFGGSTLALAHLCSLRGKGRVIGIDISHKDIAPVVREHRRIKLLEGDACRLRQRVGRFLRADDRVLIIEDSSHTYQNTLDILRLYSDLVKPGDYLVVEDSICHHGLDVGPNPGPYEAVEVFVRENPCFEIDRTRESFIVTWNPKGFLRRKPTAT